MQGKARSAGKLWFNWPLVLGLVLNFLFLGILGCLFARGR
jgi:hypothetical protein